jgi:HAD superfamily hydrolase (TIGR01549 family)
MNFIFDLDQTLVDSKIALIARDKRNWSEVYKFIPKMQLYPNIIEILNFLNEKNCGIAIVSSSPKSYIEKVLNHFNINISVIVAFHDTKNHKPDPDPILLALKKLTANNSNTFSLGDRDIDIISSKKANIKTIACAWDSPDFDNLKASNPDYFFNTTSELFEFIKLNLV